MFIANVYNFLSSSSLLCFFTKTYNYSEDMFHPHDSFKLTAPHCPSLSLTVPHCPSLPSLPQFWSKVKFQTDHESRRSGTLL